MRVAAMSLRLGVGLVLAGPIASPAAASAPTAAAAGSGCTIAALGQPDWAEGASVTASDNTGTWLAGVAYATGRSAAVVIWHAGQYTESDAVQRPLDVTGVNRSGVVVGSYFADPRPGGFVLADGAVTRLEAPPRKPKVWITGISRTGLISGWAESSFHQTRRPFTWTADDPTNPTPMRLPAGKAFSVGTSPDGHTAVNLPTDDARNGRAFVFNQAGKRVELQSTDPGYGVLITAIGDGWAAGNEYEQSSHEIRQVRWNLKTHQGDVVPPLLGHIYAISDQGVVGGDDRKSGLAELYSDHRIVLPPLEDGYGGVAYVVTTSGDAAGEAQTSGAWVATRWDCP